MLLVIIGLVCAPIRVLVQSAPKNRIAARSTKKPEAALVNGIAARTTKNGEWPHYTGDLTGARYSPLNQINAENFIRSANAPVISAGVMIANIIWNNMKL